MTTLNQAFGIPAAGFGHLHPKQANKWQMTFINIGGGGVESKDLTRQLIRAQRPNFTFEEKVSHRYNTQAYYAGKLEWQPISISFEDDVTGVASQILQKQADLQQTIIGASANYAAHASTASVYKFGAVLEMLDGADNAIETWNLDGCWVVSSNYGDLDYSNSDAVVIEMSLRFDLARQVLNGAGYGTLLGGAAP